MNDHDAIRKLYGQFCFLVLEDQWRLNDYRVTLTPGWGKSLRDP